MTIDRTNPINYIIDPNQKEEHIVISNDLRILLGKIRNVEKIYFQCEEEHLSIVTKAQFDALDDKQKNAVVEGLEKVIANKDLRNEYAKQINVLRSIRNEIFISLNSAGNGFSTLHNDVLEQLILGRTSPNQVEAAKLINKQLKKAATHLAKIMSINNGRLTLKEVLPPKITNTDEAIQWLERDKDACYFLRYANFMSFDDFNEQHLEKLTEICPKLTHLRINSKIVKLEMLPASLTVLECWNCPELTKIPDVLPASLTELTCWNCTALAELPKLPASLTKLACNRCVALTELPILPASLINLCCFVCPALTELPDLPASLRAFSCVSCYALTKLPKLPVSLTHLCYNGYPALTELPELPPSLIELDCSGCSSLTKLPELPTSLKMLNCNKCFTLTELPELPIADRTCL